MGRSSIVMVVLLLAACGRAEPRRAADDTVVLELGGPSPALGEILRATAPPATAPPAPAPAPEPVPEPVPPPPRHREVRLEAGETLYGLCERYLGDGNRWREVMELNGWRETDTRRLRPGTMVRLPGS